MSQEQVDKFFEHYGVPGMKWGRRNGGSSIEKSPPSEDHTTVKAIKNKSKTSGVSSLSNKELQQAINRMNLEQQYTRLNPSTLRRGLNMVKSILGTTKSTVGAINNTKSSIDTVKSSINTVKKVVLKT